MHPAFAILLTVMGTITFVAWCATRAGSRPTPQPDNKGRQ